jgi:dolichyl-phosphate-mannose--protein O-mannosyl transferase
MHYVMELESCTTLNITLQEYFWQHFAARAFGLILVPFVVYLSFFWIHFRILIYSGPGDNFMSPGFQETLIGNDMLMNSEGRSAVIVLWIAALPFTQIFATTIL